MTSRKLIYYVAATLDRYIAHEDGSINGFAMGGQPVVDFMQSLHQFDTVVMGKHTYEFGYQYGLEPGQPAYAETGMMNYIFSQSMEAYHNERLQVVREDPATFVQGLKEQSGKSIWLCGGGSLAGYLLDNGLIDELIVKLNPLLFGRGIPMFGESKTQADLSLLGANTYADGLVFLHYALN